MSDLLFLLAVSLLKAEVAASAAVALVLCLRGWARRLIGAEMAYILWALVPLAAVASLFPTCADVFQIEPGFRVVFHDASTEAFWRWAPPAILTVWLSGAALYIAGLTAGEHRFRRMARRGEAGPAVVGVGWMRLVTPNGYEAQFTPEERDLVRRHERAHILRDDPLANLLILAIQVISWFNPLVHWAAGAARIDQELACDEAVVREGPSCRKAYGATLLKAHLVGRVSPLACAFTPLARHPLELRLEMLARRPRSFAWRVLGGVAVSSVALMVVGGVWLMEPPCALAPSTNTETLRLEPPAAADAPPAPRPFTIRVRFELGPPL
jgi:beta-lactamase regulating signal transducer with metallopeptidase domain